MGHYDDQRAEWYERDAAEAKANIEKHETKLAEKEGLTLNQWRARREHNERMELGKTLLEKREQEDKAIRYYMTWKDIKR